MKNVNDDDEEGSGFEFDANSNDLRTVKYEQEEIENSGNSWVKPISLIENNAPDQFDASDTNDENLISKIIGSSM